MEPSDKIHATAILPTEVAEISIGQEVEWVLESTWRIWEENTFLFCQELKKKSYFVQPGACLSLQHNFPPPPPTWSNNP
jgi:hypothetical protein